MSRRRKAPRGEGAGRKAQGSDPTRAPRLVRAAFEGRLDVADALLREAHELVNALRGPHGENAMHVATRRRRVEAVKLLAARGAALDLPNADGMRAFQHAARRGFGDVCDALCAAGASDELTVGDRFAAHLLAGELDAARARAADGVPLDRTRAAETRLLADLAGYAERRAEYVWCAEMMLAAGASLAHPGAQGDRSGGWLLECASEAVAAVLRGAGATG